MTTELSQTEVIRAATNAPELSTISVTLGDRAFKVVDLEYDDYMVFLAKLQPLLMSFASAVAGRFGVAAPDLDVSTVNPASVIQYCGQDLPEMACIVCRQTDPGITVDDVKKLGKTPFALAKVVLAQVKQNRVINDLMDFFAQVLPLLTATMSSKSPSSETTR